MFTYEDAIKQQKKDFKSAKKILEKHRGLFPIANEYAERFSTNHGYGINERRSNVTYAHGTGTINAVGLMLDLGPEDTPRDAINIVHDMIRDSRLEMIEPLPKEIKGKYESIDAQFKQSGKDNNVHLRVRIWVYHSTKCKVVNTGEFEEKTKVVCES